MYRVSFEFRLTRMMPWIEDGTDFFDHVESVRAKIAAHELVADVRVITDRAESLLTFDFAVDADNHRIADREAMRLVRDAIESCDARHFGMGDASVMNAAGARSSLETPIWHRKRVIIDIAA